MNNILDIKQISKSFGNVNVLNEISLEIKKGEVHALLGANGAGKSTLIKIIGGILQKNSGDIVFQGSSRNFSSPLEAGKAGIQIIHQELSIIPQLTVLENFYLGRELHINGFLDKKKMIQEYIKVSQAMDFNIPWHVQAKTLSIANHQMIEIMKALSQNADLIIMDEPTTSLTAPEKQILFKTIRQLQDQGKTIIYISHILDEIYELCGRLSILRGGINVGTYSIGDITKEKIAELMAGKIVVKGNKQKKNIRASSPPVLEIRGLSSPRKFKNISFSLHSGEILGIAGLMGAGRTEIVRAIFGLDKNMSGSILINGVPAPISSPKEAILLGIGLVPEDRKNQGVILKQEIYKNMDILTLDQVKTVGFLDQTKECALTKKTLEKLHTKYDSPTQKTVHLSGGNQQKVAVSKWCTKLWKVMIFDEPTKGIDVNAKEDIFAVAEKFALDGAGVIFISSDLEEVLRIADRILVIYHGELVNIRDNRGEIEVADLMRDMLLSTDTNKK